jgi:hypothetical protein
MNHFIAFWNLENLFAPEGCPGRETKIARAAMSDLEGWSKVLFKKKIDFNDEPFDESVVVHAQANRDRGDVERAQTVPKLYNLSWRYMEQQGVDHEGNERLVHGTLYFNGNGNIFDQLLVSKGLMIPNSSITVQESTAKIEIFPKMVDHRVSYGPIRFGLPKGNVNNVNTNGFSDHFPVSVVLLER